MASRVYLGLVDSSFVILTRLQFAAPRRIYPQGEMHEVASVVIGETARVLLLSFFIPEVYSTINPTSAMFAIQLEIEIKAISIAQVTDC